jgi:alpha-glucoside transport system permease protein
VALVFADPSAQPITVALQSQLRAFGTNIDLLATGSFVSMIIPLAVFFAFQRFFVQGVLAGSTKRTDTVKCLCDGHDRPVSGR